MRRLITSVMAAVLAIMLSVTGVLAAEQQVTYRGDTHKIFTTSEDFFTGMNQMLPGDAYTGTATINNTSEKKVTMFFRTRPERKASDTMSSQMLKDFSLTVTATKNGKKKTVYSGKWSGDSKYVNIGTYSKGEKANFSFRVSMPKSHKNAFNMQKTSIRWIFVASEQEKKIVPVKTGDSQSVMFYLRILAAAGAVLVLCVLLKKRRISGKMFALLVSASLGASALSAPQIRTTLAYLTDGDEKLNEIIIGHNVSNIEENFPDGSQDSSGVFTRTKQFRVKNDNSVPCYVRVKVEISDGDMARYTSLNMDTANWALDGDYWYYLHPVNAGAYTTYLFTTVTVNMSSSRNISADQKDFDVLTYEESTQARNAKTNAYYTTPQEAFSAIS